MMVVTASGDEAEVVVFTVGDVLSDGSGEDEGIILGRCGAADVEVRAQRKLELEST